MSEKDAQRAAVVMLAMAVAISEMIAQLEDLARRGMIANSKHLIALLKKEFTP